MTYSLGIDLGTTASAVATNEGGNVTMATVGHQSLVIPSVVHLSADGDIVVGEAAERRGVEDPSGLAREFKRRFGDPQPLILNGSPVAANDLTLALATHLVASVTAHRDSAPDELVICHPANWGQYKVALLADTLNNSALPPHRLITEPTAAAIHDATQDKIEDGSVICVYDLGGGTFDVALLRKLADGWEPVGRPGGIERLGGIDFDSAVLHHVISSLSLDVANMDQDDAANQRAMVRLKDECQRAKHSLSADTSATVPVLLPGISHDVRITRREFESLIDPAISRTLDALEATVNASPVTMEDIDRVLLVGGSSQIPLVHQRVVGFTKRPVASDRHPKHAIALGAAASLSAATEAVAIAEPVADTTAPVVEQPPLKITDLYALPHISEAPLPDFMQRRPAEQAPPAAPAAPAQATPPPAPTPPSTPTPTPPPAPAPRLTSPTPPAQQPPTVAQRAVVTPPVVAARPAPAPQPAPQPQPTQVAGGPPGSGRDGGGKAGFWVLVALVLAAAGGITYFALKDSGDETTDAADTTTATDTTDLTDGEPTTVPETTEAPAPSDTPAATDTTAASGALPVGDACPAANFPDPNIRYRVVDISDSEPRQTLNGRNIPSTRAMDGVESVPIVEFPEFSELNINYDMCSMNGTRAWWAINLNDGVVWSSSRFIEPVP